MLQQLTFTRFPTHKSIFSSYITCRLFQRCRHRFSNLPLQVFQLIFSISSSYLTCCLFQKCQHHFSNLPSQAFQLIFSIFHHILPLVPSFITYSSFFSRLFSLYSSPLVPSFIAYSLGVLILQFSSLLIKKKTTGRNESLPKSPRKLISL